MSKKMMIAGTVLAFGVLVASEAIAAAVQSQLQKDMTRSCEKINLNATDMATCRARYAAAKNDGEREQVVKFFAAGGDQRATDSNSEGYQPSGRDVQHTPSRNNNTDKPREKP